VKRPRATAGTGAQAPSLSQSSRLRDLGASILSRPRSIKLSTLILADHGSDDSATAHFSLQRQERSRGGESRSFFSSHPPSCCFAAVVLPEWSTGASAWPIFFCGTCAAICPPRVEHWGLCMAYPFLLTLVQQFVPFEWSIGASGRPVFFCGTCAAVLPSPSGALGPLHGPSSSASTCAAVCPPEWSIWASAWPTFFYWHSCSSFVLPEWSSEASAWPVFFCLYLSRSFVLPERSAGASAWPVFLCGTCAVVFPPRVEH
jgi:hypothetical protein